MKWRTRIFCFVFVLFCTLWFWRVVRTNIWLGALILITSFLLFVATKDQKKIIKSTLLILFAILLVFQAKTKPRQNLTYLDNDQQRVQQQRLNEYPPVYLEISGAKIWIPIAHWLEGRKETITFYRVRKNFFELLDPNLYFFANHPRERVGSKEFEIFPFFFLPFFAHGLALWIKNKTSYFKWGFAIIPIVFLSFWGHRSALGPFSLLPFFIVVTANGWLYWLKVGEKNVKRK